MNCKSCCDKVHDYLDSRLVAKEVAELEGHLRGCRSCQARYREFASIQKMLSARIKLPEVSSSHCLKRIRRKKVWKEPGAGLWHWSKDLRSFLRDMRLAPLASKFVALPLTLCFFALLMQQFPVLRVDDVRFPVLSMRGWTASTELAPFFTRTYATRQGQTRFKELMDTAWRLPYEDSLSLIAEITPEGYAKVGGVLEYPKSDELFNAADLALRTSQFVANDTTQRPCVIFSFQKIDVWDRPNLQ